MSTALADYVAEGIKRRYDEKESARQALEDEYQPCYVSFGGSWDASYAALSEKVREGMLRVARNQAEVDILMDEIFSKVDIRSGEAGGDHHTGYFCEYNVRTSEAVELAGDTDKLRRYLGSSETRCRKT